MRRSTYVTLIVAAATGAALATGVAIIAAEVERPSVEEFAAVLGRSKLGDVSFDPQNMVGVSSCAASGCHGGSKPQPGTPLDNAAWRSSYVVWATSDPHARAYQTLSTPAAEAIVRKLDRVPAGKSVAPQHDRRCTACHATANPTDPKLTSFAADGIGCESCHGAAKEWLGEHFLVRTSETGDSAADASAEKLRLTKLGMFDTDNLGVQAYTCVRCHVGDRYDHDGVRDMNHDMIAAGHPALNFEFSAYKRRMPRHWSLPKTDAERADREMKSYDVGEDMAMAAALRLSADRAEDSLGSHRDGTLVPWPEFSEFSCYRCHHALKSGANADSTAQQQLALERKASRQRPVGDELWGTWGVWNLLDRSRVEIKPPEESLEDKIVRRASNPFLSTEELRKLISDQRELATATELVAMSEGLGRASDDLPSMRARSRLAGMASFAAGSLSWEEATKCYLGCVAFYRADRAAAGKSLTTADDAAGAVLKELYQALRFDKPGDRRLNSPADYDRAAIKRLFEKLATAAKEGK